MQTLWSPWRYEYLTSGGSEKPAPSSCIFCELHQNEIDDESKFIVRRGVHNYVVLNVYPYISGHLLIVPYAHLGEFDSAPKETTDELMDLTKRCQTALRDVYQPQGFNIGMNLGRPAGAGIATHIHMHIMPRWTGDTNFMSTVGETRVIPEDLPTTYQKLRGRI
ncbi:MAG TPA: HIT domain-containing protein [Pyrinomonadaceae bacterium]